MALLMLDSRVEGLGLLTLLAYGTNATAANQANLTAARWLASAGGGGGRGSKSLNPYSPVMLVTQGPGGGVDVVQQ